MLGSEGIGCIAFSPLAQGMLTDRYLTGSRRARARARTRRSRADLLTDETMAKVRALNEHRRSAAGRRSRRWRSRGCCATRA